MASAVFVRLSTMWKMSSISTIIKLLMYGPEFLCLRKQNEEMAVVAETRMAKKNMLEGLDETGITMR